MIPGLNIRGKASAASATIVNRAGGLGGEWKYTYTPVLILIVEQVKYESKI